MMMTTMMMVMDNGTPEQWNHRMMERRNDGTMLPENNGKIEQHCEGTTERWDNVAKKRQTEQHTERTMERGNDIAGPFQKSS